MHGRRKGVLLEAFLVGVVDDHTAKIRGGTVIIHETVSVIDALHISHEAFQRSECD